MKKSKIYSISDQDFITLVNNNNNYSDILRALGLSPRGGNSSKVLKNRIKELKIDTSHFLIKTEKALQYKRTDLNEILVDNSKYANIASLKRRLINKNIIEYKCSICGNLGIWNNKPLSLQLHHINGKHNDHRIENLSFLCPNCHSQTDTYAGKNKNT